MPKMMNHIKKTVTESSDLILRNPQYGLDIAEMLSKVPPAQQTYYATMLSAAKVGWTPESREKYFNWFRNASNYRGGKSFMGFIDRARKLALVNVPKAQFAHFNTLSGDSIFKYAGPFVPQHARRRRTNRPRPYTTRHKVFDKRHAGIHHRAQ